MKKEVHFGENENSLFSKIHQSKTGAELKIRSPTKLRYDTLVHKFNDKKIGADPQTPAKIFKNILFSKSYQFLEAQCYYLRRLI